MTASSQQSCCCDTSFQQTYHM